VSLKCRQLAKGTNWPSLRSSRKTSDPSDHNDDVYRGNDQPCLENKKEAEPMIPLPMANVNFASNQADAMLVAKYYLTDGRNTSDYGSRTNARYHPQLQKYNQLLLQHHKSVSLQGKDPKQYPHIIEHVYECIGEGENPYVAHMQSFHREQPETSTLPAIIRDNTTHSTIVCGTRSPGTISGVATSSRGSQLNISLAGRPTRTGSIARKGSYVEYKSHHFQNQAML
jgi:hypothetical protein